MAKEPVLKTGARKRMWVRVPPPPFLYHPGSRPDAGAPTDRRPGRGEHEADRVIADTKRGVDPERPTPIHGQSRAEPGRLISGCPPSPRPEKILAKPNPTGRLSS